MYTLTFTYGFEAAHRFTKSKEKCSTPHGHSWQASLGFQGSPGKLNDQSMIEDFAILKKSWKDFITQTVDHSFLYHWQDPILSSLRDHIPNFRGLPFPDDPTTEVIAGLFLIKAQKMGENLPVTPMEVTIQETSSNRVHFTAEGIPSLRRKLQLEEKFFGWWDHSEPQATNIEIKEK